MTEELKELVTLPLNGQLATFPDQPGHAWVDVPLMGLRRGKPQVIGDMRVFPFNEAFLAANLKVRHGSKRAVRRALLSAKIELRPLFDGPYVVACYVKEVSHEAL